MSLENTLRTLNEHHNDDVANFAAAAYDLQDDLNKGKITTSEYAELLEDLKHQQAIVSAAADLETKAMLNTALNGLIKLASAI
jgi:polyhydroxyalkanoate synthesis regulator phasin